VSEKKIGRMTVEAVLAKAAGFDRVEAERAELFRETVRLRERIVELEAAIDEYG